MLTVRALPLLAISLILYNAVTLTGGVDALNKELWAIPMLSGGVWRFTLGDFIILLTIILFFIEIIKSTFTGTVAILDHALSMVVFIICLIEFIMVRQAASSVFFFIMILVLIDVIAGYTIGIRSARRDISFGQQDG